MLRPQLRMIERRYTLHLLVKCATSAFVVYIVFLYAGWAVAAIAAVMLARGGMLPITVLVLRMFAPTEALLNDLMRRSDTNPQPNTQKTSAGGRNHKLRYGLSSMQGWRRSMEDSHAAILAEDGGFFAVFDGHNGVAAADFCGENLFGFVKNTEAYARRNYEKALYDGFIAIDKHLFETQSKNRSGCTAVALLVEGDTMYCANAGDSRCVLCRNGAPIALSVDHKPFNGGEQSRIERAGGYVWNKRVNGMLALSRAIGDFAFKANSKVAWEDQAVTSAPEVRTLPIDHDHDDFAVIACDGIWDVMSNEEVCLFVKSHMADGATLEQICERLMDKCLSPQPFGLGCDNMSVIIVAFAKVASEDAAQQ